MDCKVRKRLYYDREKGRAHLEPVSYAPVGSQSVVRFVGAFGHSDSLRSALLHELRTSAERCATTTMSWKLLSRCKVALEFPAQQICRAFERDCWSHRAPGGRLAAGRMNKYSDHDEVWVKGHPTAILISPTAEGKVVRLVMALAKMNNLPVRALPLPEQAVDYDPDCC